MSRKTIINQSGLSGITTLSTPTSTQQNELVLWDNTIGTAIAGSGVFIDNGLLYPPVGVQFTQAASNPGDENTIWINTANGNLYRGSDNLEDLSLPETSQDREVVVFSGTTGDVLDGAGVFISPEGIIYDAIGLEMVAGPANPSASASTLWIDSTDGHLHRGPVDLEAPQIITPLSTTDNAIVRWDGTNGLMIQDSGVILGDNNRFSVSGSTLLMADGLNNLIVGNHPLAAWSGSNNTILGAGAGASLAATANGNTLIGASAGSAYTGSETGNICIAASGVALESNALRIGTTQTSAPIKGIYGAAVSSPQYVVIDSTGKLGSVSSVGPSYSEYAANIPTTAPSGYFMYVRAVKIGKLVSATFSALIVNITAPTPVISVAGALPVGFRPVDTLIVSTATVNNGVWDTGLISAITISTVGSVVITRDLDAAPANFTGGDCGIDYSWSVSFVVA